MIEAWHFCDGWKLRDGQQLVVGKTYRYDGSIEMCRCGLHASRNCLDALNYAPGTIACRVLCYGKVIEDDDKLVCSDRTVLWAVDAFRVLHEFACCIAEQTLGCYGDGDQRSWDAIEAKRLWLDGLVDDVYLEAARSSAWFAAEAVAQAAAWFAAEKAARSAAEAAAQAAARSAARSVAQAATRFAAWAAAEKAARFAAWAAAEALLVEYLNDAHNAERKTHA